MLSLEFVGGLRDWVVVVNAVPPKVVKLADWVVEAGVLPEVLVAVGGWLVVPVFVVAAVEAVLPVVIIVGWLVVLSVVVATEVSEVFVFMMVVELGDWLVDVGELEGIRVLDVVEFWPDTNTDGRSIPNRRSRRTPVLPGIFGNMIRKRVFQ